MGDRAHQRQDVGELDVVPDGSGRLGAPDETLAAETKAAYGELGPLTDGRRRVVLAPAAQRELRRLPPGDAARLRGPILALGLDPKPRGAGKLVGTNFWRLRVGDLRIIYAIDAETVIVLRVARRSESAYRRIGR